MNCKGIFGRLFGHNYQPVYETDLHPDALRWDGPAYRVIQAIEAAKTRKYVHTICTQCGDVIEARLP